MVSTDGASLGTNNAAATMATTGSPAQHRPGGADAFRSSKRRIPKGPDPIHNSFALRPVFERMRWLKSTNW
ncbi:hypothetical protein BAE44_0012379 [Dichanthelium oligosanthes]|uniref:Uncharacterized protein n=1 Tax=Dichanthelium oligosanthes TaxID=888268 RepID=A0A1E5VNE9_9POAL|nr:hypothetical protein BAE44_0012379 [Dichanthelium oligosanthes]